jgi:hypothetical protein
LLPGARRPLAEMHHGSSTCNGLAASNMMFSAESVQRYNFTP